MTVDFETYKAELVKKIDAWEGLNADDFQYDPERSLLKDDMKKWLGEVTGMTDEKELFKENKKLFVRGMAALIYEQKVRPNLDAFIARG